MQSKYWIPSTPQPQSYCKEERLWGCRSLSTLLQPVLAALWTQACSVTPKIDAVSWAQVLTSSPPPTLRQWGRTLPLLLLAAKKGQSSGLLAFPSPTTSPSDPSTATPSVPELLTFRRAQHRRNGETRGRLWGSTKSERSRLGNKVQGEVFGAWAGEGSLEKREGGRWLE